MYINVQRVDLYMHIHGKWSGKNCSLKCSLWLILVSKIIGVIGKIMPPQNVLIPETCDYVMLLGKG